MRADQDGPICQNLHLFIHPFGKSLLNPHYVLCSVCVWGGNEKQKPPGPFGHESGASPRLRDIAGPGEPVQSLLAGSWSLEWLMDCLFCCCSFPPCAAHTSGATSHLPQPATRRALSKTLWMVLRAGHAQPAAPGTVPMPSPLSWAECVLPKFTLKF